MGNISSLEGCYGPDSNIIVLFGDIKNAQTRSLISILQKCDIPYQHSEINIDQAKVAHDENEQTHTD